MSYLATENFREALKVFDEAIKYPGSPYDGDLYEGKGDAFIGLEMPEQALEMYQQGLQWKPVDEKLWRKKLSVLYQKGNKQEILMAEQKVKQFEETREFKRRDKPW